MIFAVLGVIGFVRTGFLGLTIVVMLIAVCEFFEGVRKR
jgi:hypothetical protein